MARVRTKPEELRAPIIGDPDYTAHNPYLGRILSEYPEHFILPEEAMKRKGNWAAHSSGLPLHLEIGCGKGRFISEYAASNRNAYIIGLEIKLKRLYKIAKKLSRLDNPNTCLMQFDASYLDRIFGSGELNKIFLFFPDPWFKKERQAHHRLVDEKFVARTYNLLASGGEIEIKTDHPDYFMLLSEMFRSGGFKVKAESNNLHASPLAAGLIQTEFEILFASKGMPCHYLLLQKP